MQSCCCKGRQPQGIVAKKRISRPEAVGLLLKDRSVSRFLVAPDGYGKTHVAFEYACIIFAFKHVMWIRCSSPCFVRDLDADIITREVSAIDPETALVVFDELPVMDAKRVEALSEVIDALLAEGREVLVACSPSADAFGMCQKDRITVTSKDLLLDGSEVAALGLSEKAHANVPCIAWGPDGERCLLAGCAKESMPSDMRCAFFRMLVLGSGSLDAALSLFDEAHRDEIAAILAHYYTFLGVDLDERTFATIAASLELLKGSLMASLEGIWACTPLPSADALGMDIADALVVAGRPERAHEVVRSYLSVKASLKWLDKRGWGLMMGGHPGVVLDLMESLGKKGRPTPSLRTLWAWAAWLLGHKADALTQCSRVVSSAASQPSAVAGAFALMAHLGEGALSPDDSLAFAECLGSLESDLKGGLTVKGGGVDQLALGRVMLPLSVGGILDVDEWKSLVDDALGQPLEEGVAGTLTALLIGDAWVVDRLMAAGAQGGTSPLPEGERAAYADALSDLVARSAGAIEEGEVPHEGIFMALMLASHALQRWEKTGACAAPILPAGLQAKLSALRVRIERQSQERAKRQERAAQSGALYDSTHPDPYRKRRAAPVMADSSVPQLEVRMFGGLEVRIDGHPIDPKRLTRKRARTLAAALALNKGHELTRERLCRIIWPESDELSCVNSFYSVWASLKRALSHEGVCPYLVRSQVGCSLDARYLVTDMEEFEGMCTSLVFGGAQLGAWEDMYAKVTGSFADSLLPNEADNPYLSEIRERCRNRLVDGLLASSRRLLALDERTGALWFTREALRRDEAREDSYIALMEAQIAANQRGPALETYFKCRKFLSDGLGIDPSPRLVELYRSIIEYEETI